MTNYRKTYYEDDVFRIEGTVCYDRQAQNYIVNIEINPLEGMGGLEIYNEERDDYFEALHDLDNQIKSLIKKIYRKVMNAKKEAK